MASTLPLGATVYAKRPFPSTTEGLNSFLTRELSIIERAIRDSRLKRQRSTTTDLTLTDQDEIVYVDASGGAVTVTLPSARLFWGYQFTVKKIDAGINAISVDGGGALIDGAATYPLLVQYQSVTIVSTGTTWMVV